MEEKETKKRRVNVFGRILAFLGVTVLCLALTVLGLVWVFEKGPSPTLTGVFCNSVRETSILRWMSRIFLTEEELEPYILKSTENLETQQVNTSLIHIAPRRREGRKRARMRPHLN